MVVVKDKEYLVKTRVLVGDLFEATPEDGFIDLIEPNVQGSTRLGRAGALAKETGDNSEILELFRELMPGLIVDHSLYETEDKKHTPEKVVEIIFSRTALAVRVIEQYTRDVIFTPGKKSATK